MPIHEWNGKVYFGWPLPPWRGKVYEVDPEAVSLGSITVLPDGNELQLWERDGVLEINPTSSRNRGNARKYKATSVFDTDDDGPTYEGDWEHLLCLINAAAAVNALFVVFLPNEEYYRLVAENEREFENLKKKMSPRASSLVRLEPEYYGAPTPNVWLLRTGSCP
jgi:hypothetical protein